MSRRHHYRRRTKEAPDLDITTFMNLMVVLVPFLLITAVFSQITIVELTLPTSSESAALTEPTFRVEVIVRDAGITISNGTAIIATIPKVNDEYDFTTASEYMMALKRDYPDIESASVLLEPDIPYDYLIQVMDVVRSAEIPVEGAAEGENEFIRLALFTEISIGDAP